MIILSSLGTGTYREANYKSERHDEVVKLEEAVKNAMKELVGAVRPLGLELEETEATHKNEGVE